MLLKKNVVKDLDGIEGKTIKCCLKSSDHGNLLLVFTDGSYAEFVARIDYDGSPEIAQDTVGFEPLSSSWYPDEMIRKGITTQEEMAKIRDAADKRRHQQIKASELEQLAFLKRKYGDDPQSRPG